MNGALVHRLRDAAGGFLSYSELGGDHEAIRAELDELERFGFALERHPYFGVAWRGSAPRLCPDQIEWGLATRRVGRRIAIWNRVSSTNDLAAAASGSSANDGLVIMAEDQTRGRGRRGRAWVAPPGSSLLLSLLLFPEGPLAEPSWLTALGAVAVAEVVEEFAGGSARIKWPNDVRVDGKKIAGVLVERGAGAIVGIGLNANFEAGDLPLTLRESATSLRAITGVAADRSQVARSLIRRLDDLYLEGLETGPRPLARKWADRLEPMGRTVVLETRNGEIAGRLIEADLLLGLRLAIDETRSEWVRHATIVGIDGECVAGDG